MIYHVLESHLVHKMIVSIHLLERAVSSPCSLLCCNGSQSVGDEVRAFRRRMRIHVYGDDCPPCIGTFADMDAGEWRGTSATLLRMAMSHQTDTNYSDGAVYAEEHIKQVLLRNIEESTWLEPTPIQMQALPIMLQGRVGALLLSTPCLPKSSPFSPSSLPALPHAPFSPPVLPFDGV